MRSESETGAGENILFWLFVHLCGEIGSAAPPEGMASNKLSRGAGRE